mgnify:CR=1 FL=1
MADYASIQTQFVVNRLRETRWEDREYIQRLMGIERIICQGGPKNGAARVLYDRLVRRYPVEHGAIYSELSRGEVTSDSQFRLLCEAQQVLWCRQEQMDREVADQAERKKQDRLDREKRDWIRQGGLE